MLARTLHSAGASTGFSDPWGLPDSRRRPRASSLAASSSPGRHACSPRRARVWIRLADGPRGPQPPHQAAGDPGSPVAGRPRDALGREASVGETRYFLDASDVIVRVGGGWNAFALAGDAPAICAGSIEGRSLWDFVRGDGVREILAKLFERARAAAEPIVLPFRCDGPKVRRHMVARLQAQDDLLLVATRVVKEERRFREARWAPDDAATDRLFTMCSWCCRVRLGAAWCEVEEALDRSDCLGPPLPAITHGICPSCRERLTSEV